MNLFWFVLIFGIFLLAGLALWIITLWLDQFQRWRIRGWVMSHPTSAERLSDGTYQYCEGDLTFRYRVIPSTTGALSVQWLSVKQRLNGYQRWIKRIQRQLSGIRRSQRWLILLRPPGLTALAIVIILIYAGAVGSEQIFARQIERVTALVLGLDPSQVQYQGGGWFSFTGKRFREADHTVEPIRVTAHILGPLTGEPGYVIRYKRLGEIGYIRHPFWFSFGGGAPEVWLKRGGRWLHGEVVRGSIAWDEPPPVPAGSPQKRMLGHELGPMTEDIPRLPPSSEGEP